ncbi:hypothetical protein ACQYAD_02315 [Neobacillus sp. SM06]|uniref:hypothetical protein n=1 Tax=Neobacillus sp. SM06 TaxID=3422492 RepID=UPI003D2A7D25
MGLPFSIALTMIIGHFFYYQKKALNFLQNSILFMALTLLTTNLMTIAAMNINKLKLTDDPYLFLAFPLYRDVILPIIVLIFVNAFILSDSLKIKSTLLAAYLFSSLAIDYIHIYFGVIGYTKWQIAFPVLFHSAYIASSLFIAQIITKKEQ